MNNETIENYLKECYRLHQKSPKISLTQLSERLKVSKSATNSMVKKMGDLQWVEYNKYKPIKLTSKGEKQALLIIRKHRLVEMFLSKIMGFGWEEVHEIAEEIEHIDSEKFFDRISELLGNPNVDPHGSPIPNKKGEIKHKPLYKKLSEEFPNKALVVKAVTSSSKDLLLFLNKKNIHLNTVIVIKSIESFDKSITVILNNEEQILSHEVSQCLLVEKKV